MTAILRVKRRYDDEPLNALVISCKRQKIVENEEEAEDVSSVSLTTFAKFAGTVKQHVCIKKRVISSKLNIIFTVN